MGNLNGRFNEKAWYLQNVEGHGGKYKTLNKFRQTESSHILGATRARGKKPVYIKPSEDGATWVLAQQTTVSKSLRVVEPYECGSIQHLMSVYGYFLVTDRNVVIQTTARPIVSTEASLLSVLEYLDLGTPGKKDGRIEIQVQKPREGQTKLLIRNSPTLEIKGEENSHHGFRVYEIFPSGGKRMGVASQMNVATIRASNSSDPISKFATSLASIGTTVSFLASGGGGAVGILKNETHWILI